MNKGVIEVLVRLAILSLVLMVLPTFGAGNPTIRLEVEPTNADVRPFSFRSTLNPDGLIIEKHEVVVRFTDRAGQTHEFVIASQPSPLITGQWILKSQDLRGIKYLRSWLPDPKAEYFRAISSIAYGGYRGTDGTVYSVGGYASGLYTFYSRATLSRIKGWSLGFPIKEFVEVRSAETQASSYYAGIVNSEQLRKIIYYAQRIWLEKAPFEFSPQIDGPYSPNPNTQGRPWIGGIFLGFEPGSVLDRYFRNYGLKGFMDRNSDFTDTPDCGGGEICSVFEAYDPDWIVGVGSTDPSDPSAKVRAEEFMKNFLRDFAVDNQGYLGGFSGLFSYGYRGLSRIFSPGEYDPKGFLLFETPARDYLFFSKTGKFKDGEEILVVELPRGIGATFRAITRWGEMKKQLPECKNTGCP